MEEEFRLTDELRQRIEEFRSRHRTAVLTLVFTDLVGSTSLKERLGDAAGTALINLQQTIVRGVLESFHDGEEISTAGDSFFIAFTRPSDAVRFCLLLQASLRSADFDVRDKISLRVGLHMGEVFIEEREKGPLTRDILGIQVDTSARIQSLADGGQILMSKDVFNNARSILRGTEIANLKPLSWLNHGPYQIKGCEEPIEICEIGEQGLAPLTPPANSPKAYRYISPDQEPVLGWRPALDLEIPNLAGWVLTEKLGEGGFGEVWRSKHKTLKETRIFKFCFRADRVRSLKREVTLFRLLKEQVGEHPNIVKILDVYFDEPPFYIGMEDVPGKNLIDWCDDHGGPAEIPEATKLEIIAQVADALQAAHDSGIIHRDVKPSNILVAGEPHAQSVRVRLTDFGIGQVAAEARESLIGFTETIPQSESPQTGTRLYMAPEVLAGNPSTSRSDIFSLAVVLYQFLIGDFRCAVASDWNSQVSDPVLTQDLAICFSGEPSALLN